jgi:hypothetical protein
LGQGKIVLQLAHETCRSCFVLIYSCTMLDFVGQACTQEFKDKNKPSKHWVQDCWLEWPQLSWTDVSEHMGICFKWCFLIDCMDWLHGIFWCRLSFEQLDVHCSVQFSLLFGSTSI